MSNCLKENLVKKSFLLSEGPSEDDSKFSKDQLGLSKLYEHIGAPIRLPEDFNIASSETRTAVNLNFDKLPEVLYSSSVRPKEKVSYYHEEEEEENSLMIQTKTISNGCVPSTAIPLSPYSQTLFYLYPKHDPRMVYLKYKSSGDWEMRPKFYASYLINVTNLIRNKNGKGQSPINSGEPVNGDINPPDDALHFSSFFESGNLFAAFKVSENEYDLILQNDINTRGHTQWFFFSVSNTIKGQCIRFNIVNLQKSESLFNEGMKPAVFSMEEYCTQQEGWKRAGYNISYFKNNIVREGGVQKPYYTLSFSYKFQYSRDTVYFAHSFPYTYSDLKSFLNRMTTDPARKGIRYIIRRSLCYTLAKNDCEYLSITAPSTPEAIDQRYGVVLTARQHPGESLASYMMEGVIEFLTSEHPEAQFLRDHCVFKIVPMLNPDGVIHGNYRTSLSGKDLNRIWNRARPALYPTIHYTKEMIQKVYAKRSLQLVCDLHGHSRKKNAFFYGNATDTNPYAARIFPMIMSKISKYVSFEECRFVVQRSKESTARISLWRELNIPNIFTLEASFFGYEHKGHTINFTKDDYRNLGADLCKAISVYLKQIVIPKEERWKQKGILKSLGIPLLDCQHLIDQLEHDKTLIDVGNQNEDSGSDTDNSDDDIPVKELNKVLPFPEAVPKKKKKKSKEPTKKKSASVAAIKKEEKIIAFGKIDNSSQVEVLPPKVEKPRFEFMQSPPIRTKRLKKVNQILKIPLARSRFYASEEFQQEAQSELEILYKPIQTEFEEQPEPVSNDMNGRESRPSNNLVENKLWLYPDRPWKIKIASPSLAEKGSLFVVGAKTAQDIINHSLENNTQTNSQQIITSSSQSAKVDATKMLLSKLKPTIFQKELKRSQTAYMPYRQTPENFVTADQFQKKESKSTFKLEGGFLRGTNPLKISTQGDKIEDLKLNIKSDIVCVSPIKEDREREIAEARKISSQKILEHRRNLPLSQSGQIRYSSVQKSSKRIILNPSAIPQIFTPTDMVQTDMSSSTLNNSRKLTTTEEGPDDSFSKPKINRIFPHHLASPSAFSGLRESQTDKRRERVLTALPKGLYNNLRMTEVPTCVVPKEQDVSPFKATAIKPALYNEFRAELEQKVTDTGLLKPKVERKPRDSIIRKV